jgi:hypothetical protein
MAHRPRVIKLCLLFGAQATGRTTLSLCKFGNISDSPPPSRRKPPKEYMRIAVAIPHRKALHCLTGELFRTTLVDATGTSVCADEIMLNARLKIRLLSDFLEESEAHLSESPAHWVSACQKTVPEY